MTDQKPAGHQGLLQIKRMVDLIMKVNCQNYALISEVAKEMGMKKTAVMQFVDDNPKLFKLVEVKKGDKVQGLGIRVVYETPNQNPETEEWLEDKKAEWDHKLHVGGQYYYNTLEFWFFPEERSDSRESKYRNTQEKLHELEEKGIFQKKTQGYGGLSDYYKIDVYPCNTEILKKLEEAGWTTDFDEVVEKSKE